MAEEPLEDPQDPEGIEGEEENFHFKTLLEMFDRMSLREWWARVQEGLKADKDSGEYRWARAQFTRIAAPISAILVPLLVLLLMVVLGAVGTTQRVIEITIVEPEPIEELEDIEEPEPEEFEPPEPVEMEVVDAGFNDSEVKMEGPDAPFSPQPTPVDAVALVKSPVVMKGIFGARTSGERGSALGRYGGSGNTEAAVLRALRWLKHYQNPAGFWDGSSGGSTHSKDRSPAAAMTSLALLTFLAHGETPASEEFGETVEKAIKWLVSAQDASGHFSPRDTHDYTHPICTYALSEAFALTRVPMVKYAAEKAAELIVRGQHASGGWNYNLNAANRDDTSYIAWCVQALKAAKMAELEVPNLDGAMKKAISGTRKNQSGTGRFGYTAPGDGTGGLTGAGVLSLQFLGAGNSPAARRGIQNMANWQCAWGGGNFPQNPLYYWYYGTQAKFHAGGATWNAWNKQFSPVIVKAQTVVKGVYTWKGKTRDIGYWTPCSGKEFGQSFTYNTTLCALMLQVYYRYLPTYKPPKEVEEEAQQAIEDVDGGDIEIQIL